MSFAELQYRRDLAFASSDYERYAVVGRIALDVSLLPGEREQLLAFAVNCLRLAGTS